MIEATANILNPISATATLQTQISAIAELNFTISINHFSDMKWTDTFTHADDADILVSGQPLQRHIVEIPENVPLNQLLVMLDNTPLDSTHPDASVRDIISWENQIMTFRKKPLNFSLRILYPTTL